jgi:hypothetical protein
MTLKDVQDREVFNYFLVTFLAQFCPIFEHFQNLAKCRHFEKGDHSQRKINYMLLDRPTISLPSNVNIVSVMFTGVRQCSFALLFPPGASGPPGVKKERKKVK